MRVVFGIAIFTIVPGQNTSIICTLVSFNSLEKANNLTIRHQSMTHNSITPCQLFLIFIQNVGLTANSANESEGGGER